MADILHNLVINAERPRVFRAVSTPDGLNNWWTLTCSGRPEEGADYRLGFGPEYNWQARVSSCIPNSEFELTLTHSDDDWQDTRLRFTLNDLPDATQLSFQHLGWPEDNEHYRTSCFCWAMYLRLMKRFVEFGEVVPYDNRLEV